MLNSLLADSPNVPDRFTENVAFICRTIRFGVRTRGQTCSEKKEEAFYWILRHFLEFNSAELRLAVSFEADTAEEIIGNWIYQQYSPEDVAVTAEAI